MHDFSVLICMRVRMTGESVAVIYHNHKVKDQVSKPITLHQKCAKGVYRPCVHVTMDSCEENPRRNEVALQVCEKHKIARAVPEEPSV